MVFRRWNLVTCLLAIPISLGLIFSPLFLFPRDALADVAVSTSLTVEVAAAACADGIDNDGDGKIDYPADPGCSSASDNDETDLPPPGGGAGGVAYVPSVPTKVILKGLAYPGSSVTILKDGRVVTTVQADPLANFNVEITDITAGIYTFGVWSEDKKGVRSRIFSFTTSVTDGMITTVSGIFLPPTINLDKEAVTRGENIGILGQTAPESNVSIFVYSEEGPVVKKTKADTAGSYFYNLDTTPIEEGAHAAKAKSSTVDGLISDFSEVLSFQVLYPSLEEVPEKVPERVSIPVNINRDFDEKGNNIVNLIDVSILLFNWGIPKNSWADINKDGQVDLIDFSILLYHWTG